MNNTPNPLTPSPDSPASSDAITLHIKCDPNLTNDDSDELVVHVLPEGRVMLEIYQGPGLGTNYVMTVLESIPAMQLKTFIGEMSYEHQKALVHISELESDLRFSADVNEKLDRVITHLEDGLKRIKTRSCFSECVNVADRVLRETREQLAAARTQCELRSAGHDDLRTKLNQANGQLRQLRAELASLQSERDELIRDKETFQRRLEKALQTIDELNEASQPDLTLIEEVREAVEYAIKAADCDDNHKKWEQFTQLLARLNPRK